MDIRLRQGFHGGAGANALNGWTDWWQRQHAIGHPVNAIFADNAGPIWEIQEDNFNEDTLVWRRSLWDGNFNPNVPNYSARPEDEAIRMLSYKYMNLWPPELDKQRIWLKDTNEIRTQDNPGDVWFDDLEPGEWWGRYARTAAEYAVQNNYRVILLSPSSGDHTEEFWSQPSMLSFLSYACDYRENVTVGLHEYSFVSNNLYALSNDDNATLLDLLAAPASSRRVGRFELLFNVCDGYGIGDWPNIYFCEWGWAERDIPSTQLAVSQIVSATHELYGPYYKYIKGFGTWYLGLNFGSSLPNKTNTLLEPCADIAINNVMQVEERFPMTDTCNCPAITDVRSTSLWIPQYHLLTDDELAQVIEWAISGFKDNNGNMTTGEHMLCPSHVDALRIHTQGLPGSILGIAYPDKIGTGVTLEWIQENCPCALEDDRQVVFLPHKPVLPTTQPEMVYRPSDTTRLTQGYQDNPGSYPVWSGCGHGGIDAGVGAGLPFYATQDGIVVHASDRKWTRDEPSGYGWHVVLEHTINGQSVHTVYAHAEQNLPVAVGDFVQAGDIVGYSGNTGTSTGYHLHYSVLVDFQQGCFPQLRFGWFVDPTYVMELPAPDPFEPTPPPSNSPFGLHFRADPNADVSDAEYNEQAILLSGGGKTAKLLHNHPAEVFHRVCQQSPETIVIRVMQSWGGRNVTPQQFYDWTWYELADRVRIVKSYGIEPIIEAHNEPNLVEEGLTLSWADGTQFGYWLQDVLALYRAKIDLSDVKYIYPGLSPGETIANVRQDSTTFLVQSIQTGVLTHVYGVACHAYWSQGWTISTAIAHVNFTKDVTAKPVYVTECSINDRPAVWEPFEYGIQYAVFRSSVNVKGIYFFVGSASNPYFEPETWVTESGQSKGIATHMVNALQQL